MSLNYFLQIFFWLFLISIPFGFRILLYQFTPGFHEYESVFLYVGDFLLAAFLVLFCFNFKNIRCFKTASVFGYRMSHILSIFLFFMGLSVLLADYKLLALYNFIRLALLVLFAFAIGKLLKEGFLKLEKIFAVLGILAVVESLIGVAQFYYQKSLGLWFLGESVLEEGIRGVAKIDIEGGHFLRAYGTFPHPNVLAAFLLLGLFSLFYFWTRRPVEWRPFSALRRLFWGDLLIGAGLFIVLLGLVLTFSRASWLIAVVLSVAFLVYLLMNKNYWKQSLRLFILLSSISYMLFVIFSWAILPRAQISANEPAVSQRLSYNELGFNLLKSKPFGVGIGNQVIYAVKNNLYQDLRMSEVWQWQPIHNLYLLISSEIGVFGLIIFLVFIAGLLVLNFPFLISKQILLEKVIVIVMLSSLLLFGFFDHFLWTLQPGRLMFWLVIGLMI